MNKYILILLFIFGQNLFGQYTEIHCKHFIYGYPKGSPTYNNLIIRDIYALSSNDSTKFADWVAYRLDSATITGPSQKERKWMADPWLDPSETLEPEDYKNAPELMKIDRGHQAPLANFKGTPVAWETNYLSNITPQKSDLNRGVWKELEDWERILTMKYKLIYVMTGPLYEEDFGRLPNADEPHRIPSGYWKIIIIPNNQNIADSANLQVFGFIFSQNTPPKSILQSHLVSIDEIEKRSKLDFFWQLSTKTQSILESKPNPNFYKYFQK